eukprot:scaffold44_cov411-Prasinococcus_capsulatus_cf.AAC.3
MTASFIAAPGRETPRPAAAREAGGAHRMCRGGGAHSRAAAEDFTAAFGPEPHISPEAHWRDEARSPGRTYWRPRNVGEVHFNASLVAGGRQLHRLGNEGTVVDRLGRRACQRPAGWQ